MLEHKIKFVLDTNTIITGLLWKGNEFQLLKHIEQEEAIFVLTNEIVAELEAVLHYPRLSKYIQQAGITVEELLAKICSMAILQLDPVEKVEVCRDRKDNKFISCVLAANADYIVSGDDDLLVLKEHKGIKILTTKQALEMLPG